MMTLRDHTLAKQELTQMFPIRKIKTSIYCPEHIVEHFTCSPTSKPAATAIKL